MAHRRQLSGEDVWRTITKGSFAVVAHSTPTGKPRSSGVVYTTIGRRLLFVVAADGWKARHIAPEAEVAVTVPVRRGGVLAVLMPIPPATISFHGTATVHPPGSPVAAPVLEQLGALLPEEGRGSGAIVEVEPEGTFVIYGLGVSLLGMRDPDKAQARVPVPLE